MDILERINRLESAQMENRLTTMLMKNSLINPKVPEWAKEAYNAYKAAGYNCDDFGHSMDFYRIITLLYDKKLL